MSNNPRNPASLLLEKMPEDDAVRNNRRITLRDWLALLPWDIIYALGVVLLIALVTLLAFLIAQFS